MKNVIIIISIITIIMSLFLATLPLLLMLHLLHLIFFTRWDSNLETQSLKEMCNNNFVVI